jgi:hypothetical protein
MIAQSETFEVIATTQEETDESTDVSQYNTTLEIGVFGFYGGKGPISYSFPIS